MQAIDSACCRHVSDACRTTRWSQHWTALYL